MKKIKDDLFKILVVVCLVLSAVCMFRISSLKQDNADLKNRINSLSEQNNRLRNEILSDVDSKLKEYDDVLVSAYYDYEDYEFDVDNPNVKVKVEVLPKIHEPNVTQAYLVDINGQTYPLEYKDSKYVKEIPVPLFEHLSIDHVVLDNNGVLSSQALNWVVTPEEKVLPTIQFEQTADVILSHKNSSELSFKGDIQVLIYANYADDELDVKAVDLVIESNDSEIERIPLKIWQDGTLKLFELEKINKKYDLNTGDKLYFYIDITEGDFTIRRLIDAINVDADGHNRYEEMLDEYRCDTNIRVTYQNQVVYDISSELFQ